MPKHTKLLFTNKPLFDYADWITDDICFTVKKNNRRITLKLRKMSQGEEYSLENDSATYVT